jgi:Ca2+-binding EF-hand superfamily protein
MLTYQQAAYALLALAAILGLALFGVTAVSAQVLGSVAELMFDRVDANRDGKVTREEARAALAAQFDRIDADRSGTVTLAEIEAAKARVQERKAKRPARLTELRTKGGTPSQRFTAMDKDGDGKVTREEFANAPAWFDRMAKGDSVSRDDFIKALDAAK